ncbi:hypothetical protein STENM327S_08098 [Streptomyces tendae]
MVLGAAVVPVAAAAAGSQCDRGSRPAAITAARVRMVGNGTEMDFDLLVNHAHLDEWDDVILLALAHARPKEDEQMLRRLTELDTPRGTLLAAAGLRYAAEVAPGVRGRVEQGLATHVPADHRQGGAGTGAGRWRSGAWGCCRGRRRSTTT